MSVIKFRFYSFDLHIARFLLLTLFGKLSGKLQVKLQIIPCNSCQVAINVEYLLVVFSVPFFNVFVPFFAPCLSFLSFTFFYSPFNLPTSQFYVFSLVRYTCSKFLRLAHLVFIFCDFSSYLLNCLESCKLNCKFATRVRL